MSKIKSPTEKKLVAYERDHYPGGGQSDKAWRKMKPRKKAKARRAFRKASNDLLRVCSAEPEAAPESAVRKQGSVEQRRVPEWGPQTLREFVATRRVRNQLNTGAKQARRSTRLPVPNPALERTPTAGNAHSVGDTHTPQ